MQCFSRSSILIIVIALFISGCCLTSGNSCKRAEILDEPGVLNNSALEGFELEILSKTMGYALGSPFDMKMRLTNNTDKVIELKFPDGRAFDFFIYQKNQLIYRFSEDERYPTGLKEIRLFPGQSKDLGGIWLCKDRNGIWVRGGRYQLIGIINSTPPIISDILLFGLTD